MKAAARDRNVLFYQLLTSVNSVFTYFWLSLLSSHLCLEEYSSIPPQIAYHDNKPVCTIGEQKDLISNMLQVTMSH